MLPIRSFTAIYQVPGVERTSDTRLGARENLTTTDNLLRWAQEAPDGMILHQIVAKGPGVDPRTIWTTSKKHPEGQWVMKVVEEVFGA